MGKNAYRDVKAEQLKTMDELAQGLVEYAQKHQIPLSIVEGCLRDTLAQIEAHRSLQALRAHGARV